MMNLFVNRYEVAEMPQNYCEESHLQIIKFSALRGKNKTVSTRLVSFVGATMFHYYLKIVPTTFLHQNNTIVQTNQFSVTKHMKVISGRDSGMPGIFFTYEISPLMVKYTEKAKSIGHTLTNLCSIIGGVVTVARILDSIFYHSHRAIQKIELGKSN